MTDIERVNYDTVDAAVRDLTNLSRMLEITRAAHARTESAYHDLDRLIAKLMSDRAATLRAIDAMTETAPRACGADISPYVESTGESMLREVTALEREAAEIVRQVGGLDS